MRRTSWVMCCVVLAGCGRATLAPAALDTRNDACASCRMAVSNPKLAGQIVESGEDPRFFDDLGCLAAYVHEHGVASNAAAFVADHRTGAWVPARHAVFTRVASLDTPMGSHIVAHADAASRDTDSITGVAVAAADIVGEMK